VDWDSIMTHAPNRTWSAIDLAILQEHYANSITRDIATALGIEVRLVYAKANHLGLHKSAEFSASDKSGRILKGGKLSQQTQFKPGLVPWNKGTHFTAGGRSSETRFKKGVMGGAAKHNYLPIGTLRISKDGYLERKTTDDPSIYPARRWVAVHRIVWEAAHGQIPYKHIVVFKRGQKTAIEADITPDRLECISRAEHARRNHPNSYSPELAKLVQLKGAITRQVNRIQKETHAS